MFEIHDWVFLSIVLFFLAACAVVAFITPLKKNQHRNKIKRVSLVLFIITTGFLLFCFIFMYMWQNHFKIL